MSAPKLITKGVTISIAHPLSDYSTEIASASYSFTAALIRPVGIGTWTFLDIPAHLSATFGTKSQVKVKG
ncbi:MAG: hypothetical protein A2030_04640 [Chloroflexi bacterium RBG_19FT_COMBO_50_10]|nr:MAG: hypothetical protein A2030_04640 [Chloroflexi bacterium RBG_19FT_COMBO_50_10]